MNNRPFNCDWSNSLDDQEPDYWEDLCGGPDEEPTDFQEEDVDLSECDEDYINENEENDTGDAMGDPADIKGIDDSAHIKTRNCPYGYKCEMRWADLIATDQVKVRFCHSCDKEVYYCENSIELSKSIVMNRCVAFNTDILLNETSQEMIIELHRKIAKEGVSGELVGFIDTEEDDDDGQMPY